jgi:hypothetical protein
MMRDEPALLVHWEHTLHDLLDRTCKFPKVVRFTFSTRIDNLALDIVEKLALARYARPGEQRALLAEADGALARLRVLVRLSFERRYLERGGFEHVVRNLDEAGRMLGGWRKALEGR